jgi:hypothetical protein
MAERDTPSNRERLFVRKYRVDFTAVGLASTPPGGAESRRRRPDCCRGFRLKIGLEWRDNTDVQSSGHESVASVQQYRIIDIEQILLYCKSNSKVV